MATIIPIDPVTRLEGHLKIELKADRVSGALQVTDAWASGSQFRGIESILIGRSALDAPVITQRVCGVCPVSHATASVLALESAAKTRVPANARVLRNLVLGTDFLHNHLLHFYLFALPDFIQGSSFPSLKEDKSPDRRFSDKVTKSLQEHAYQAMDLRRKSHELGALFGGRMPHPAAFIPGGWAFMPDKSDIDFFKKGLSEIVAFLSGVYADDVEILAAAYSDYGKIGGGRGNYLAYGGFDLDSTGETRLFHRGILLSGSKRAASVDPKEIVEETKRSWYKEAENRNPARGSTEPMSPKDGAYSWIKAPRYAGNPCETGPLARMAIRVAAAKGLSVLDRHRARSEEALLLAKEMLKWTEALIPGGSVSVKCGFNGATEGIGWTEAPRGALGHWVRLEGGVIKGYQIVTPTCWNASPRDEKGTRGPMEEALIGVPLKSEAHPIEALRVIRSFDPCLDCAVHAMRPGEDESILSESNRE